MYCQAKEAALGDETDTVEAFTALGGNPDKSGEISTLKLRATIQEFGLTIDIEQLIRETDKDGSGKIDYEECVFEIQNATPTHTHTKTQPTDRASPPPAPQVQGHDDVSSSPSAERRSARRGAQTLQILV